MERVLRGASRFGGAVRLVALLLAAGAVLASTGCDPEEESCNCSCGEGKVCASSTEGRTGCGGTFLGFMCVPSDCCDYCCDP